MKVYLLVSRGPKYPASSSRLTEIFQRGSSDLDMAFQNPAIVVRSEEKEVEDIQPQSIRSKYRVSDHLLVCRPDLRETSSRFR